MKYRCLYWIVSVKTSGYFSLNANRFLPVTSKRFSPETRLLETVHVAPYKPSNETACALSMTAEYSSFPVYCFFMELLLAPRLRKTASICFGGITLPRYCVPSVAVIRIALMFPSCGSLFHTGRSAPVIMCSSLSLYSGTSLTASFQTASHSAFGISSVFAFMFFSLMVLDTAVFAPCNLNRFTGIPNELVWSAILYTALTLPSSMRRIP